MNNTKKLALASVIAIAAFMIAATTIISWHDGQARLVIPNIQFQDNNQNIKLPDGTSGQTFINGAFKVQIFP